MKRLIQSRLLAAVALTTIIAITAFWVSLAFAQQSTPAGTTAPSAAPPAGGSAPAPTAPTAGPGTTASPLGLPGASPAITAAPAADLPAGPTPPLPAAGGPPSFPAGNAPASGGANPWGPRFAQPDTIRAELDALLQQESHTRQLMSEYSQLVDENQREAIVRELSQVVARQFDIRQEIRHRELERLEAQIRKLRELHDKRARFRNEIIHERVRQLLRDLDGIGWGADGIDLPDRPRGGGATGMPMPGMGPAPVIPPDRRSSSARPTAPGPSSVAWSPATKSTGQGAIAKSRDHLKELLLAMHNYNDAIGNFPGSVVYGPDGKTPHSWRVALLPCLGQNDLYNQYKFDEPWDSDHNRQLLKKMPEVFRDPNAIANTTFSSYFLVTGAPIEPAAKGWRLADIHDGTSNTIALVEAVREIPWTKPEDIEFSSGQPLPKLGGHHDNQFLAGLYDGSVRILPRSIAESTLRALLTPQGGEVIDASQLGEPTRVGR